MTESDEELKKMKKTKRVIANSPFVSSDVFW